MEMDRITRSMRSLNEKIVEKSDHTPIPFETFLRKLVDNPTFILRNVFQAFHDMVVSYLGEGVDEYPDDPESINYVKYDCNHLFVEGVDHPFFADRLFANRFVNLVKALKRGAQQNMVYIFRGPPGCGKSTFLNNLLLKIEEYSNTEEGLRYEIVWRFNRRTIGKIPEHEAYTIFEKLYKLLESKTDKPDPKILAQQDDLPEIFNENIDIPCPSHDHPILIIPKKYRRAFLENLFEDSKFKEKLFSEVEYDWVFKENPCTICSVIIGGETTFNAIIRVLSIWSITIICGGSTSATNCRYWNREINNWEYFNKTPTIHTCCIPHGYIINQWRPEFINNIITTILSIDKNIPCRM